VPTLETIDILLELAFKDGTTIFHGYSREELKKLLIICTQESHFQFNGKYYDQIDGVAMGSPLGPLFANVFMSNFERKHMNKLQELGLRHWWRYVDDIFASFNNKDQAEAVLQFLNQQHPNIRFTIEYESKNSLPFLDTLVVRRDSRYSTTVYRKKTFTGVYLNWNSLTARRYKIGLIRCLCERIWRITSDNDDRMIEMEKLKIILSRNEYPPDIVEKTINKFIEKKSNLANNNTKTEKEIKRFLKLPYISKKCEDFAYRMKKLVNENFPQVDFNVAFQAPATIGMMFPFKDKTESAKDRSLVVYSMKCETCGVEYIGKTQRILFHRVKEHKDKPDSAINKHLVENEDHFVDFNKVEILDSAENDMKLRIKELMHILSRRPELNIQLGSQSSYEIKTLIINAYPQFRTGK
jgi:hypothetical protein